MFETLQKATLDKIFVLMAEYAADPRDGKIDLGVGVYKDPGNNTPIMTSVKKAEQRILDSAKTKTYKGVVGNKEFSSAIVDLALGGTVDQSRIRTVNGAGGTGALMILMHVLGRARPGGRIFISDPTWPNHIPLAENAGLSVHYYPYFNAQTRGVDFDAMMQVVDGLTSNDILLIHGCCRNPTGANLTNAQWDRGGREPQAHRRLPARRSRLSRLRRWHRGRRLWRAQGGDQRARMHDRLLGLEELRPLPRACRRRHRHRQGLGHRRRRLLADAEHHPRHHQPDPDHGAEVVRVILEDKDLRAEWETELTEMRERMKRLRVKLADAIRQRSNSKDFDFIAQHSGMFSLLGLPEDVVTKLKLDDAIYMINDSRINVAGIPEDRVGELADKLLAAVR